MDNTSEYETLDWTEWYQQDPGLEQVVVDVLEQSNINKMPHKRRPRKLVVKKYKNSQEK